MYQIYQHLANGNAGAVSAFDYSTAGQSFVLNSEYINLSCEMQDIFEAYNNCNNIRLNKVLLKRFYDLAGGEKVAKYNISWRKH